MGDLRVAHGQRAEVEADSPTEGVLSRLRSVLSAALCGASLLTAGGPLPFILGLRLLPLRAGAC